MRHLPDERSERLIGTHIYKGRNAAGRNFIEDEDPIKVKWINLRVGGRRTAQKGTESWRVPLLKGKKGRERQGNKSEALKCGGDLSCGDLRTGA